MVRCVLEVDLVCSDAKAADNNEIPGLCEYPGREFRLRTDTYYMHISMVYNRSAKDSVAGS